MTKRDGFTDEGVVHFSLSIVKIVTSVLVFILVLSSLSIIMRQTRTRQIPAILSDDLPHPHRSPDRVPYQLLRSFDHA